MSKTIDVRSANGSKISVTKTEPAPLPILNQSETKL